MYLRINEFQFLNLTAFDSELQIGSYLQVDKTQHLAHLNQVATRSPEQLDKTMETSKHMSLKKTRSGSREKMDQISGFRTSTEI